MASSVEELSKDLEQLPQAVGVYDDYGLGKK